VHRIAVLAGEAIGREVIPAGIRVIEAAARRFGFCYTSVEFAWDSERQRAMASTSTWR
jgi:tartrate dehydrogenase/decarboxylase/D-malate dehydrogenase